MDQDKQSTVEALVDLLDKHDLTIARKTAGDEKPPTRDVNDAVEVKRSMLAVPCEIRSIDADKREVVHVISTKRVDRHGDIVDPRGWDLRNYRTNPVVLLDHNSSVENIVGHGKPRVSNGVLETTTTFGDIGKAAMAFALVESGLARAWSVGFAPIHQHRMTEGAGELECEDCIAATKDRKRKGQLGTGYGMHYTKQELWEYSLVAIGSNADAVTQLQAKGFKTDDIASLVGEEVVRDALDRAKAVSLPDCPKVDPDAIRRVLRRFDGEIAIVGDDL